MDTCHTNRQLTAPEAQDYLGRYPADGATFLRIPAMKTVLPPPPPLELDPYYLRKERKNAELLDAYCQLIKCIFWLGALVGWWRMLFGK